MKCLFISSSSDFQFLSLSLVVVVVGQVILSRRVILVVAQMSVKERLQTRSNEV